MLLRRFAPLAAALALAAPVLSGCGAEDAAGVDVAEAAAATAKKGTASYTFRVSVAGVGLPSKVDLRASGVTSLTKPQMTVDADLGSVLASLGIPLPGAAVQVRLDGDTVYVKPPKVQGFPIPGGKEWLSIDLTEAVESFGVDADGLGALMSFDPAATLRLINSSKGLKEVGKDTINGTETRHFRGTYDLDDMIAALPEGRQAAARKALKQLDDKLGSQALPKQAPVDFWIDKDGIMRRMASNQAFPAAQGAPAGKVSFTYDLTKFGTPLDVSKPASVYDATQGLLDALEQFKKLSGTGTLG